MNSVIPIPVDSISPFEGQPRRYFDEESLVELSESIREHGQSTPAWVVPVGKKFGLIAGERRWRACKMAGIPTLICEVRKGLTEEQRYIASVMENFGRKDCTSMETARSVGAVLKLNSGDFEKTAKVFARSSAWARQYNSLLKLVPEVAEMLEPPEPKINMVGALSLANLQPEFQLKLAKEVTQAGLRHRAALRHIKASISDDMRNNSVGRPRKPSDDFEVVQRFLSQIGPAAEEILAMGPERIGKMFAKKSSSQLNGIYSLLSRRINQLDQITNSFEKFITHT